MTNGLEESWKEVGTPVRSPGQRWCWPGLSDAAGMRYFSRHQLEEGRRLVGVDKQS